MPSEALSAQLTKLSKEPGVYLFYDRSDRIIYIGKAINLRSRVRSYWNESHWDERPKLKHLVPKITRIETIITKSEKEALILESNLVFKHQPKYNVLLKDNKSFPWLVITYDEAYPRLIPIRNIDNYKRSAKNTRNKFFGPYTNVSAMYENLNLVHELFPLRRKKIPPFKNRPCLNYDLGKCLGPCQKLVSEEDYGGMIRQVEMLLKGDHRDLRDLLEAEMMAASDNLEYEKAANLRDRIKALETFNERQNVISENTNLNQDIFALVVGGEDLACLQIFKIRSGKVINRETSELEFSEDDTEDSIFEEAFVQYYAQIPDSELPDEIILSHKLSEESNELFSSWLSERHSKKVKLITPKQGDKYAQVELARRNGKVIIEKIKLERMEEASKNINLALSNLQRELDMRTEPSRIECFDISHMQGTSTVASMVTFIDGMPAKDDYRRFKISRDQNDDFASMREVVTRRYSAAQANSNSSLRAQRQNRHCEPEGRSNPELADTNHNDHESLPNLIIIDGGKGQLNAAYEILRELGLDHIRAVGLAKKEEEIYLPGENKPIILDRKSPELFLMQRIRNEAHRFAITYHRKLRSKRSTLSELDAIPGLGPAKKKTLLKHFGTLNKLKDAGIEEICKIPGINTKIAENIKSKLNS